MPRKSARRKRKPKPPSALVREPDYADTYILTPALVAELFGVSPRTVRRWADSGTLPSFGQSAVSAASGGQRSGAWSPDCLTPRTGNLCVADVVENLRRSIAMLPAGSSRAGPGGSARASWSSTRRRCAVCGRHRLPLLRRREPRVPTQWQVHEPGALGLNGDHHSLRGAYVRRQRCCASPDSGHPSFVATGRDRLRAILAANGSGDSRQGSRFSASRVVSGFEHGSHG
jgi:hypothetical protein